MKWENYGFKPQGGFGKSEIREIARDPFYLSNYIVARESNQGFFKNSYCELTYEQSLLLRFFNEFYNLITHPDREEEDDMFSIIQTEKGIERWKMKLKERKTKERK